jgi:hypothetical protein
MLRVREILTVDNPAVFSEDIDVQIRATFEGLVIGDSLPPPGWKPPAPARTRERRNIRRARRVKDANAS